MKKLLIVGAFVMSFGVAVAGPKININTPVEWATSVINAALNQVGLIGSSDANWDVRVTHDRILAALLEKKTFSLKQAIEVCLGQCNKSDFLKNGKGASGKKCPDICKSFSDALLAENNKAAKSSTGGKGTAGNTSQKPKTKAELYAERVKKNGYCKYFEDKVWTYELDRVDVVSRNEENAVKSMCEYMCYSHASRNACKLNTLETSRAFASVHNSTWMVGGICKCNHEGSAKRDYTPTYETCLKYSIKETCDNLAK